MLRTSASRAPSTPPPAADDGASTSQVDNRASTSRATPSQTTPVRNQGKDSAKAADNSLEFGQDVLAPGGPGRDQAIGPLKTALGTDTHGAHQWMVKAEEIARLTGADTLKIDPDNKTFELKTAGNEGMTSGQQRLDSIDNVLYDVATSVALEQAQAKVMDSLLEHVQQNPPQTQDAAQTNATNTATGEASHEPGTSKTNQETDRNKFAVSLWGIEAKVKWAGGAIQHGAVLNTGPAHSANDFGEAKTKWLFNARVTPIKIDLGEITDQLKGVPSPQIHLDMGVATDIAWDKEKNRPTMSADAAYFNPRIEVAAGAPVNDDNKASASAYGIPIGAAIAGATEGYKKWQETKDMGEAAKAGFTQAGKTALGQAAAYGAGTAFAEVGKAMGFGDATVVNASFFNPNGQFTNPFGIGGQHNFDTSDGKAEKLGLGGIDAGSAQIGVIPLVKTQNFELNALAVTFTGATIHQRKKEEVINNEPEVAQNALDKIDQARRKPGEQPNLTQINQMIDASIQEARQDGKLGVTDKQKQDIFQQVWQQIPYSPPPHGNEKTAISDALSQVADFRAGKDPKDYNIGDLNKIIGQAIDQASQNGDQKLRPHQAENIFQEVWRQMPIEAAQKPQSNTAASEPDSPLMSESSDWSLSGPTSQLGNAQQLPGSDKTATSQPDVPLILMPESSDGLLSGPSQLGNAQQLPSGNDASFSRPLSDAPSSQSSSSGSLATHADFDQEMSRLGDMQAPQSGPISEAGVSGQRGLPADMAHSSDDQFGRTASQFGNSQAPILGSATDGALPPASAWLGDTSDTTQYNDNDFGRSAPPPPAGHPGTNTAPDLNASSSTRERSADVSRGDMTASTATSGDSHASTSGDSTRSGVSNNPLSHGGGGKPNGAAESETRIGAGDGNLTGKYGTDDPQLSESANWSSGDFSADAEVAAGGAASFNNDVDADGHRQFEASANAGVGGKVSAGYQDENGNFARGEAAGNVSAGARVGSTRNAETGIRDSSAGVAANASANASASWGTENNSNSVSASAEADAGAEGGVRTSDNGVPIGVHGKVGAEVGVDAEASNTITNDKGTSETSASVGVGLGGGVDGEFGMNDEGNFVIGGEVDLALGLKVGLGSKMEFDISEYEKQAEDIDNRWHNGDKLGAVTETGDMLLDSAEKIPLAGGFIAGGRDVAGGYIDAFDSLKEGDIGGAFKDIGEGYLDGMEDIPGIGGAVKKLREDGFVETAMDAYQAIDDGLNKVGDTLSDGAEKVGEFAGDAVDAVGDGIETVGEGIKDGAEAVGEGIKDGAEAVGEGIKDGAEAVGDGIKDGFKAIGGLFS